MALSTRVSVPTERVTFKSADGVSLTGTYVPAKTLRAPALLLLHMLGRDRHTYDDVLEPLRQVGFATLAIDFRGHGESRKGPVGPDGRPTMLDWESFTERDWAGVILDAQAGIEALRRRRGVDPTQLGVVGASIGANAALQAGVAAEGVRALVLLSPGLDYRGVGTSGATDHVGTRAVMVAAAEQDTYSFDSSKQLVATLPSAEFATLASDAHGTNMLATDPTLLGKVVAFLGTTFQSSSR